MRFEQKHLLTVYSNTVKSFASLWTVNNRNYI